MEPILFDGANVIMGKDQPEYVPLPAYKAPDGTVTTCWKLTPEELKQVNETGVIWLSTLTFNQPLQPILLCAEKPPIANEDERHENIPDKLR